MRSNLERFQLTKLCPFQEKIRRQYLSTNVRSGWCSGFSHTPFLYTLFWVHLCLHPKWVCPKIHGSSVPEPPMDIDPATISHLTFKMCRLSFINYIHCRPSGTPENGLKKQGLGIMFTESLWGGISILPVKFAMVMLLFYRQSPQHWFISDAPVGILLYSLPVKQRTFHCIVKINTHVLCKLSKVPFHLLIIYCLHLLLFCNTTLKK